MQKFLRDMKIMTRLMKLKLKEIPIEELKVDYKTGVVSTSGRPVLKTMNGDKRSEKVWHVDWVPEGSTFKILFAPRNTRGPRKR
jgi:hypothetical protein